MKLMMTDLMTTSGRDVPQLETGHQHEDERARLPAAHPRLPAGQHEVHEHRGAVEEALARQSRLAAAGAILM